MMYSILKQLKNTEPAGSKIGVRENPGIKEKGRESRNSKNVSLGTDEIQESEADEGFIKEPIVEEEDEDPS